MLAFDAVFFLRMFVVFGLKSNRFRFDFLSSYLKNAFLLSSVMNLAKIQTNSNL